MAPVTIDQVAMLLRKQGDTLKRQDNLLRQAQVELQSLRSAREQDAQAINNLKLGNSFREVVRRAAESVQPFHYVFPIPLPAASTAQVPVPFTISADGWFFADRVFASWRMTGGANVGRYMPLGSSDPTVATVAAPPADRLDFAWGYAEDRTSRGRQSQGQFIPGDLLYRSDTGYGYLLGGDPWAPSTTITVTVVPTVAPANNGTLFFVFLGEQCLHTSGAMLDQWVTRKRELGI